MDKSVLVQSQTGRKSNYFRKEILTLKIFGLSVIDEGGLIYKIYSLIFISGTICAYTILDGMEYFKQDFDGIADMMVYQVASFLAFSKVSVLFHNRKTFAKLLLKFETEPFLPNPKRGGYEEEELIKECLLITSVQTYAYWITSIIAIVTPAGFLIAKRIETDNHHEWQHPYGKLNILNITKSPQYEITMLYQTIAISFIAGLFTSIDLLLAAVLAHISYQFKVVQNNFRRFMYLSHMEMMEDTNGFHTNALPNSEIVAETDGCIIPRIYLYRSLKRIVQYHTAIIDIAAEIEESFSFLFLIVFLGTLAMLCFIVYGASNSTDTLSVVKHVFEGMACTLQVGTVCYWGQRVMEESQLVGRAVYESNFVGSDLRLQKMLSYVIRRSQKPTIITAGKFSEISLATFGWILRTSYSSFMVLRNSKT